jgi:hypothetical protein
MERSLEELIRESNQKIVQGIELALLNTEALIDIYEEVDKESSEEYLNLLDHISSLKEGVHKIVNGSISSLSVLNG